MPHSYDKRSSLSRALRLLEIQDDDLLRYVCLELRFCLEAIAYEKLNIYAKRLPKSVLNTWQPPQVIRALLEFEPLADQDFELRISPESALGVPTGNWTSLGSHHTLRLSWLRKSYNKLGNYLHVPLPDSENRAKPTGPVRQEIQKIAEELMPVVESSIDCSLALVIEYECSVCNSPSVSNIESARKRQKVVCLNSNCQAEFFPTFRGEADVDLQLISTSFDCLSCGAPIAIENRKLSIGLSFTCNTCKASHQIAARQWGYSLSNGSASNG